MMTLSSDQPHSPVSTADLEAGQSRPAVILGNCEREYVISEVDFQRMSETTDEIHAQLLQHRRIE